MIGAGIFADLEPRTCRVAVTPRQEEVNLCAAVSCKFGEMKPPARTDRFEKGLGLIQVPLCNALMGEIGPGKQVVGKAPVKVVDEFHRLGIAALKTVSHRQVIKQVRRIGFNLQSL